MLNLTHLSSVATALGFFPAEDTPQWQMRRFLTLSIFLVLGSSTVFIGAASLMKVNEISGQAPAGSPARRLLSKDVCIHHLY
jgi:hypothetical protein